MATVDLRRRDERDVTLITPFWIISGEITYEHDDDDVLLFSFPSTRFFGEIYIQECVFYVSTAFTSGALLDIGIGTIATDDVTTGGTFSNVDSDEFFKSADLDLTTTGYVQPTDSDWEDAKIAGQGAAMLISPTTTDVPMIHATLTSTSDITAGAGRLLLQISCLPPV